MRGRADRGGRPSAATRSLVRRVWPTEELGSPATASNPTGSHPHADGAMHEEGGASAAT